MNNYSVTIDVKATLDDGDEFYLANVCIILGEEISTLEINDNTETKIQQLYVIEALRDFADAMERELNRQGNKKLILKQQKNADYKAE